MEKLKLHLGCADNTMEGWVNIDSVADFKPDLIHDLSNPLPFADQSADELLAKDLLEHFDKYVRYVVFYDWARVLKIGGIINLEVPNFEKILKKQKKFTFEDFADFIFGENMIRSKTYSGHYGNHKFGYSAVTLAQFVAQFGIEPVSVETPGLNITLKGKKIHHVQEADLDTVMIHSHANSFGDTPNLALGVVREKIQTFRSKNGKDL